MIQTRITLFFLPNSGEWAVFASFSFAVAVAAIFGRFFGFIFFSHVFYVKGKNTFSYFYQNIFYFGCIGQHCFSNFGYSDFLQR